MLQSYRESSAKADLFSRRDAEERARLRAEFYTSRGRAGEAARYRALGGAAP